MLPGQLKGSRSIDAAPRSTYVASATWIRTRGAHCGTHSWRDLLDRTAHALCRPRNHPAHGRHAPGQATNSSSRSRSPRNFDIGRSELGVGVAPREWFGTFSSAVRLVVAYRVVEHAYTGMTPEASDARSNLSNCCSCWPSVLYPMSYPPSFSFFAWTSNENQPLGSPYTPDPVGTLVGTSIAISQQGPATSEAVLHAPDERRKVVADASIGHM